MSAKVTGCGTVHGSLCTGTVCVDDGVSLTVCRDGFVGFVRWRYSIEPFVTDDVAVTSA